MKQIFIIMNYLLSFKETHWFREIIGLIRSFKVTNPSICLISDRKLWIGQIVHLGFYLKKTWMNFFGQPSIIQEIKYIVHTASHQQSWDQKPKLLIPWLISSEFPYIRASSSWQ